MVQRLFRCTEPALLEVVTDDKRPLARKPRVSDFSGGS